MKDRFSLDNFKKWIKEQKQNEYTLERPSHEPFIGLTVEPKVELKKLMSKMISDQDVKKLAEEFIENGGTIIETEGKQFYIQVPSGKFSINRVHVRRA